MTAGEPRIETLEPKKLVGVRLEMSFSGDRTPELWRRFMPRRHEVSSRVGRGYISMKVFRCDPAPGADALFEGWAAVEVENHDQIPEGMEPYVLAGGRYAVFVHEGPAAGAPETFGYIFGTWLPRSSYVLDGREHFEILPEDYRPDDPEAKEEVWIPIREPGPENAG